MMYFLAAILVIRLFTIAEGTKKLSEVFTVIDLNAEQAAAEDTGAEKKSEKKSDKSPPPEEELHLSTTKPEEFTSRDAICSQQEIDLLKSLAKRRDELDKWKDDALTKQTVLQAAEAKVNTKLEELAALKAEVEKLLAQYNTQEDKKIASLVKIYENMKPKDAAVIFNGLENDILLQVIDKMKEAKVAPILAQMDSTKATEITTQYAQQKRIIPKATP
jgi:flagellar motility protein MotE (MotC chaperone)